MWFEWLARNSEFYENITKESPYKFLKKFGYSAIIVVWTLVTLITFALAPVEHHDITSVESPTVQEEVRNTKIVVPETYTSKNHEKEIHKSLDDTLKKEMESFEEFLKESK
jgi:hypothetical protein